MTSRIRKTIDRFVIRHLFRPVLYTCDTCGTIIDARMHGELDARRHLPQPRCPTCRQNTSTS